MSGPVPGLGVSAGAAATKPTTTTTTIGVNQDSHVRVVSYTDGSAVGVILGDASNADVLAQLSIEGILDGRTGEVNELLDGRRLVLIQPRAAGQAVTVSNGEVAFSEASINPSTTASRFVSGQARAAALTDAESFGMAGLLQERHGSSSPTAAPTSAEQTSAWENPPEAMPIPTDDPADPLGIEAAREIDNQAQVDTLRNELNASAELMEAELNGLGSVEVQGTY